MVCDSVQCLPPEWLEFSFNIEGVSNQIIDKSNSIASSKSFGHYFSWHFLVDLLLF